VGSNIENRLRRKAEAERVAAQARETRKKRIVVAGVIVVVALLVIGGAF
jgi:t-SNARE complex subunit (syntaxin)